MAKNRNQNRDRGTAAPTRGGGETPAEPMETPQTPAGSGMNQEMSRKRKKKFGHN